MDAPTLLSRQDIAARAAGSQDVTRGALVAAELERRGARLRARAAQIRRAGIAPGDRNRLLRRADALKSRQD